uniref:FP protein C-terminal domain-containing protein n=1 Tax=Trichogramma kaykai TaxID=54128 RepID=A0ABD2X273_9HYME
MVSCRHCHKPKDLPITTCAACGACYHDDCLPRLNTRLVKACCVGFVEGGDPDLDGAAERRRTDCALTVSAIRVDARTAFLDARRGLSIDSVDSEVDMSVSDGPDALGAILAGQRSLEAVVARQGARLEVRRALKVTASASGVSWDTDLRVHGVPISVPHDTSEALAVTFKALLTLLGSPDSVQDAVRTFSFAVTFKQPVTRNYILQRKYKHSLIKYADIQQGGPDAEIRLECLNELLPGPAYRLFRAARERGREHKYSSVWGRDGRVFARKSVGSEPIELVTEADLNKLV